MIDLVDTQSLWDSFKAEGQESEESGSHCGRGLYSENSVKPFPPQHRHQSTLSGGCRREDGGMEADVHVSPAVKDSLHI